MRKYLAATVLGAMLVAGQAAANDSGVVNLGDRIGSPSAAADSLEGHNNGALWFALAAILVIAIVSAAAANTNSGVPTSP